MGANKFPIEVLPEALRAIILERERVSSWDKNTYSASLLSASASIIGSKVKFDDLNQRIEKPILWLCIVGESGTGKSPIIKSAYQFLYDQDQMEMESYYNRLEEWENSGKEGAIPSEKNYIISDYTPEVLIPAHRNNPNGLAVVVDELAGWIKGFDQYKKGSGGQKEATLSLFNGGALKANRASKKVLFVAESCINVIGGIQPSKLSLINGKESQGDGFLPRFLMLRLYPSLSPKTVQKVSSDLTRQSYKLFEGVFNYPETVLTMESEAETIYYKWWNEADERTINNELERSINQKLDYYVLRFSIVLEVLNQVATGSQKNTIGIDTMEKAIKLVEFFRIEALSTLQETYDPLAKLGTEAKELYLALNGRTYSFGELEEHFKPVWRSPRTVRNHLTNKELFTQENHGTYRRVYVVE